MRQLQEKRSTEAKFGGFPPRFTSWVNVGENRVYSSGVN